LFLSSVSTSANFSICGIPLLVAKRRIVSSNKAADKTAATFFASSPFSSNAARASLRKSVRTSPVTVFCKLPIKPVSISPLILCNVPFDSSHFVVALTVFSI